MNRIGEILAAQKRTQRELARSVHIDEGELSKIIHGKKNINLETAKKIARALGYSVEYIWPD